MTNQLTDISLFKQGDFTLHSGDKSDWIIDCNALSDENLKILALIGSRLVEPFSLVYGIPRGGLRFEIALIKYAVPLKISANCLVVDDVLTTGKSMQETMEELKATQGLVIFARGPLPKGVKAIWNLGTI